VVPDVRLHRVDVVDRDSLWNSSEGIVQTGGCVGHVQIGRPKNGSRRVLDAF